MRGSTLVAIPYLLLLGGAVSYLPAQVVNTGEPLNIQLVLERTLKTPSQPIRGLAFGGERPGLAAVGEDDNVQVWDAATGDLLKTIILADHPKSVSCLAFSPDGKSIVIGESFTKTAIFTARVELVDVAAGQEVRTLATHHWEVESLSFSADGKWLVSSNWDRKVRVLEFPSGNQVREFESPAKPRCAAISPDAKVVAAGDTDGTIMLWDREEGKELRRLSAEGGEITSVCFTSDGRRVASSDTRGYVRVWDTLTGKPLDTLPGHVGAVLGVVFSPDGKFVASGGADGTVRLWDPATGQNLETLGAHSSVWQVAFSSDGKYLAAGYGDGTINLWKKRE